MVTVIDPEMAMVSGLSLVLDLFMSRHFWKVKNTDAFLWVLIASIWCLIAFSRSLQM
jgi:hypothetical protein